MGAIDPASAFGAPARVGLHSAHETLSRDALAALQLERLRATLRNAWDHVGFNGRVTRGNHNYGF